MAQSEFRPQELLSLKGSLMDSLGRLVVADASWGAEEQRRGRRTINSLKAQIIDIDKTLETMGYRKR